MSTSGNLAVFVPHAGCPNQCSFCNQRHISGQGHAPEPHEVTALCEQYLPAGGSTEIAFFGGSFTAIDRRYMESLLQAAAPFVQRGQAAGIRISTRPDAIDSEILATLAHYSVTAIELGAQSMDDAVLAANRRGHTAQQVRQASELIKDAGFSLGLQMMTGLYGEKDAMASALDTAQEFVKIKPDTVRIYPTVVVANTALCDWYQAGVYAPLTIEAAVGIGARLVPLFEQAEIRILRIGLHADEVLQQNVVAGPYHPALGELVYARQMRATIEQALEQYGSPPAATIYVHPKDVSRAVGHNRDNIAYFAQKGIHISIKQQQGIGRAAVRVETV